MLTCQNLCLERGGNIIYKNLGFSLQVGGCLIIKGNNGSGKTSLIKSIATILPHSNGEIYYNQTNIKELGDDYRYLINFISHDDTLDENLTVIQNLTFWAEMYDTIITLPAAAKTFAIDTFWHLPVKKISKGMRKKVNLTLLLLKHKPLWLLDEPFANLDNMGMEALQSLISIKCSGEGIVIISTNQPIFLKTPLILNIGDYKHE